MRENPNPVILARGLSFSAMSSRQTYSYGGIGDSYRSSYGGSAYDGAGLSSIYSYRTSPRLPSVETYSATDTASLYADKLAAVYSKQGLGTSGNYSAATSSLYGTSAYDPSLLAGTKRSMEGWDVLFSDDGFPFDAA